LYPEWGVEEKFHENCLALIGGMGAHVFKLAQKFFFCYHMHVKEMVALFGPKSSAH
jgi:hypothetical protein